MIPRRRGGFNGGISIDPLIEDKDSAATLAGVVVEIEDRLEAR